MTEAKNILPIWQPVGSSTHLIAHKMAEKYGVKTSHTGTLDPMAEGVVIVLLGEERLKKYEYANWIKKYEFEITFGLGTDTFDGMGIITTKILRNFELKKTIIPETLKKYLGKYTQDYPIYSTKKIKGKHLHEYARINENITLPRKSGYLYSITLLDFYESSVENLAQHLIKKITKVEGNFRQKEIINQWKNIKTSEENLQSCKISVETSKGIYIRQLSQDICKELNVSGFVSNLVRVKNGDYSRDNSYMLDDKYELKM